MTIASALVSAALAAFAPQEETPVGTAPVADEKVPIPWFHAVDAVGRTERRGLGAGLVSDGRVALFDPADGRVTRTLDLGGPGRSVALSPDGDTVAVLMLDATLRIGPTAAGGEFATVPAIREQKPGKRGLHFAATTRFSPDGERLLVAVAGGPLVIVGREGQVLGRVESAGGTFFGPRAKWSPDGRRIAVVTDGEVHFCDGTTGASAGSLATPGVDSPVKSFDFAPEGELVATGHDDAHIVLWNVATGSELRRWRHRDPVFPSEDHYVNSVAFGPRGKRLAFTSATAVYLGCVEVDSDDEPRLSDFCGGRMGEPTPIAWSPDGASVWWAFASGGMPLHCMRFGVDGPTPHGRSATPVFVGPAVAVVLAAEMLIAFDPRTGERAWTLKADALDR